jgi:hypothetical protein
LIGLINQPTNMAGYIYLIRPELLDSFDAKTALDPTKVGSKKKAPRFVYKIGRTESLCRGRLAGYGPDAKLVLMARVSNMISAEKLLIKMFEASFGHPASGREYFNIRKVKVAIRLFDAVKYEFIPADDDFEIEDSDEDQESEPEPDDPTDDDYKCNAKPTGDRRVTRSMTATAAKQRSNGKTKTVIDLTDE